MTEQELIAKCREQDRIAQRTLYERYKRAMYTLAYRITNDWELASEVLQDAFLRVFQHIDSFEGRSTLGAWIKTIVVRTAVRKAQTRPMQYDEINEQQTGTQSIDWGHHLDCDYLERAIQALPEGYRAVFVLAEVEGYAHKEIADMLNISEGTSKSQLFYAKKRLREAIATV